MLPKKSILDIYIYREREREQVFAELLVRVCPSLVSTVKSNNSVSCLAVSALFRFSEVPSAHHLVNGMGDDMMRL